MLKIKNLKFVLPIAPILFWVGLEMSGIEIPWLGYSLMALSVLLLLILGWAYIRSIFPKEKKNRMLIYLGILLAIGGIVLVVSQLNFQKQEVYIEGHFSELGDEEIQNTIREWLDKPSFTVRQRELPDAYFHYGVDDDYNRRLSIYRDKTNPHLIQLRTYMVFDPSQIPMIIPKQTEMINKVSLELAKLGVGYHFDINTNKLDLSLSLKIDDSLNELKFLEGIGLIVRSLIVTKATILEIFPEFESNS